MANVLNPDQIKAIRSQGRTKGAGEQFMQAFLRRAEESGETQYGEAVDLEEGPFAGKSADSAAATLNNAKRKTVGNPPAYANPQFQQIEVKKVGKGDEALVAVIYTQP